MASLTLNILREPQNQIFTTVVVLFFFIAVIFIARNASLHPKNSTQDEEDPSALKSFLRFFYASFLKPHNGDGTENGQQDALESFYKAQAGVYDATRKRLLRGRKDMLALVAAQLVNKASRERTHDTKRIWVDVSFLLSLRNVKDGTFSKPSPCEIYKMLIITSRLAVALDGISRRCLNMSQFQSSSLACILSISLPVYVKLHERDSSDLAGRMSRLYARMLAHFVWKTMKILILKLPISRGRLLRIISRIRMLLVVRISLLCPTAYL